MLVKGVPELFYNVATSAVDPFQQSYSGAGIASLHNAPHFAYKFSNVTESWGVAD